MTDKEHIKQEIEKRVESMNSCPFKTAELGSEKFNDGELHAYKQILQFIDSFPEEPSCEVNFTTKSEDLEESARYYLLNNHVSPLNDIMHQADLKAEMQYHKDIENAFKAGAEWADQKNPSVDTVKKIICYALKHTNIMLAENLESIEWDLLIKKAMEDKS